MSLDNARNFAKATLSTGIIAGATSLTLVAGGGLRFPTPPFNATLWNATDYPDPSDDPLREIVRVTNIVIDTLTITRAQEGTSAQAHNLSGKTHLLIAGLTAKVINTDIPALIPSVPSPSLTVSALDGSGAAGSSTDYSRGDHKHSDSNRPADGEKAALAGTSGTPGSGNKYVTDGDARNSNPRSPTSHATTHKDGGGDEVATATPAGAAIPKADGSGKLDTWISDASTSVKGKVQLATTSSDVTAGHAVQASDARLSDARPPNGSASGDLAGTYPSPTVAKVSKSLVLAGTVTSDPLGAGTYDDFDVTGLADATTLVLVDDEDTGGDVTLTGVVGGVTGRILIIVNGQSITGGIVHFEYNGGTSSPSNRFVFPQGGDTDPMLIELGAAAIWQYSSSSWSLIGVAVNPHHMPNGGQADALQGTNGVPSNTNRYVTNSDSRLTPTQTVVNTNSGTTALDGVFSLVGKTSITFAKGVVTALS